MRPYKGRAMVLIKSLNYAGCHVIKSILLCQRIDHAYKQSRLHIWSILSPIAETLGNSALVNANNSLHLFVRFKIFASSRANVLYRHWLRIFKTIPELVNGSLQKVPRHDCQANCDNNICESWHNWMGINFLRNIQSLKYPIPGY